MNVIWILERSLQLSLYWERLLALSRPKLVPGVPLITVSSLGFGPH